MIGYILLLLFCGWYMWIQYLACIGVYNDYKKSGENNIVGVIFIYLFRCSWAIFLIIYGFINMMNQ